MPTRPRAARASQTSWLASRRETTSSPVQFSLTALALANTSADSAVAVRFYACVAHATGAIRIVGPSIPCRLAETRVWWNQAGPAGQNGVSGYEVVKRYTTVPAQPVCPANALCMLQTVTANIPCPAGKRPVGGGYEAAVNATSVLLLGSHPTDSTASAPAWVVSMYNPDTRMGPSDDATAYVYAVCLTSS